MGETAAPSYRSYTSTTAVFTGPDGFTPDPLTEFELERLSARSYARMERPAEHTPAFLDRQARKSALAHPPQDSGQGRDVRGDSSERRGWNV